MKTCRYCGTVNEDSLDLCAYCHASLPSTPDPEPVAEPKKKRRFPKKAVLFPVLAALIAVCAVFGVIWMRKSVSPADAILICDSEKNEYHLISDGKLLASYPTYVSNLGRTARSFRSADGTTTVFVIPREGNSAVEPLDLYCLRGGKIFPFGEGMTGYEIQLSADGLIAVYQKPDGRFAVYRTDLRKETLTFGEDQLAYLNLILHPSGNALSVVTADYSGDKMSETGDYLFSERVIDLKTGKEQTFENQVAIPFGKNGKSLLLISEEGFSLRKDGENETRFLLSFSEFGDFALNAAGDEAFAVSVDGSYVLYADGRAEKVSDDYLFPVYASSGYYYSKEIPSFKNCFCIDVDICIDVDKYIKNLYLLSKGKDGKSVSVTLLSDRYYPNYENRIPEKRMAFVEADPGFPQGKMTMKIASLSGAPVETVGTGKFLRYEMTPDEKALVSLDTAGTLWYYRDGTNTELARDIDNFSIAKDGTVVARSNDGVLYEIDPARGANALMTGVSQVYRFQHGVFAAVENPTGGTALFYYDSGKLIPCGGYGGRTY